MYFLWAVVLLSGAAIGSAILAGRDRKIGIPAPDFRLMDEGGNRISLIDYRGNIVLLNYGPTW